MLFIYFLVTLSTSTYAQQLSKQDKQFVDSVMEANYKADEPGAVLLIAKNGQPIFRKAYGLASVELNVCNKPEYVFRIGSMSKQFTAVCMLQLAQEGKVNLQDDITKYLPSYNTHGRHIRIENLLNHTCGIINYFDKKESWTKTKVDQPKEELMNFFMNDSLAFEPGADWGYSNSGYMVAGLIIEKVAGMSLSEYLRQNIFGPLEMSHTYVMNYDNITANAVNGYEPSMNGKFQPARYISSTWVYAAGDILSNVDDLLKWDNALYTEKILKKEWLETAWKPSVLSNGQTANYGLGWSNNTFHGLQIIEHAGTINGFSSDGIRIPSKQLYMVILSNKQVWTVPILSSIALRNAGQTLTKPSATRIDKKMMEEYTGVYAIQHSFNANSHNSVEQTYQSYTVQDDTLFSQPPGYPKSPLLNISKDIFGIAESGLLYYNQFHRNEKGKIISVELYTEPIQTGPHEIQIKTDLELPKEKRAITLDATKLEALKGKYSFGSGTALVTVEGNRIYVPTPGVEKEEIFAEDDTHFFSKTSDVRVEFIKDNNKVTKMIVSFRGANFEGKRIE